MVQLTVHVSVSGLPVLTILYNLILIHKRTKSQILKAFFFYIFLTFGQFHCPLLSTGPTPSSFKKKKDLSTWIREQPYMQMDLRKFFRNNTYVSTPGKLSGIQKLAVINYVP